LGFFRSALNQCGKNLKADVLQITAFIHIHFLLDEHEASFSDELASETPFIGALELTGMKEQQKADLFAISPEILDVYSYA